MFPSSGSVPYFQNNRGGGGERNNRVNHNAVGGDGHFLVWGRRTETRNSILFFIRWFGLVKMSVIGANIQCYYKTPLDLCPITPGNIAPRSCCYEPMMGALWMPIFYVGQVRNVILKKRLSLYSSSMIDIVHGFGAGRSWVKKQASLLTSRSFL